MVNRVELSAAISALKPLRHTPAGVPALDLQIEHAGTLHEAGQPREVKAALRALALGVPAERLARQAIGSRWVFHGFLASPRNARSVVLHIQDFQQDSH